MNDRIHRSATAEQRILIEQAEDRGFALGMERRAAMDIEYLDSIGLKSAAEALRTAKVVERTEGQ